MTTKRILSVISISLGAIGGTIFIHETSLLTAVGLLLVMWGNNITLTSKTMRKDEESQQSNSKYRFHRHRHGRGW